jgi:hypothetical protein
MNAVAAIPADPGQPSTPGPENQSLLLPRIGPDEQLINLADAARQLPRVDGRKIAISTIWRWCRLGLRGVRLEYVRVGRKICTSREALLRFFAALAKLDARVDPNQYATPAFVHRAPITSRRRLRALQQADEVLARAGI